jgi:hypothetical protein
MAHASLSDESIINTGRLVALRSKKKIGIIKPT